MHFFFLLWAPTHHGFTFNCQFLYKLKVRASKSMSGIFHFRFRSAFIWFYIFFKQKEWTPWLQNVIIPFNIKKNKNHRHFHSNTSDFFKSQQEFLKFDDICESWSSPKTDMETNFLHLQNPNFENFSFCR